jgi:hypothetical protein
MKLSDVQRRLLKQLANIGEEWLDLTARSVSRPTIRALLAVGALEQRSEGFPGQIAGQAYRVTPAGRAAVTPRGAAGAAAKRNTARPAWDAIEQSGLPDSRSGAASSSGSSQPVL